MNRLFRMLQYVYRLTWSNEKYARKIGVKIGKNCLISTRQFSSEPYLIEIGDGCRIVSNVVFLPMARLTLNGEKWNIKRVR